MKSRKKNFFTRKLLLDLSLKDLLFLVAGSFLYAFGVKAFVQPANIAPGGVNGIVVYRLDVWNFNAFDRACSYDWKEQESWLFVAPDGLRLIDSLCGSTFNILDGNVLGGPAKYPARRYNTHFDGMRLRVYS